MSLLDQIAERDRKAKARTRDRQWGRFREIVAAAETAPPHLSADLIGALITLIKGARDDA